MASKKMASKKSPAKHSPRSSPRKSRQRFSEQERIVLPGSERPSSSAAGQGETPVPSRGMISVSVILRRKNPLKSTRLGPERMTRAEFRRSYAADPAALRLLRAFAREAGLTVAEESLDRRTVKLTGTATAMQNAFGVKLVEKTDGGGKYRTHEGGILLPSGLSEAVEAVLGLDTRPQAKPHFRIFRPNANNGSSVNNPGSFSQEHTPLSIVHAASPNVSYTPVQIAGIYRLPSGATAKGETIGILELGGGYRAADLKTYFQTLGQSAPRVTAVSVDGGKNTPGDANGADGEVMLDIEVAGAIAPGANIVVYFAPNTDQGFIDAITTAVHDTTNQPTVLSISWGGPESSWTAQAMQALDGACQSAAALGITITVAAGDNGSSDGAGGNNVDFPASSPHVLSCGGTKLLANGTEIASEVVWNEEASHEGATGGGVSNIFPLPSWQAKAGVPPPSGSSGGRGVPDVAGNADPSTGYQVRVDGQNMVIGGTSAVAPLWAGLIAINNKQNGKSAGLIQPLIYATKAKSAFHDITSGNNGAFSAQVGWDACTGWGSPIGVNLISLLGASAPAKGKKAVKGKKKATGRGR